MKQPPIIGITTYARDKRGNFKLGTEYVDAVRRAGGIPILIPPGEDHQVELLDFVDGFILSGGGEVNPALYHGRNHETIAWVDYERDFSEIALVRRMLNQNLPMLCICRGLQVINVALGGTLIEHLPDEVGDRIPHRLPPRDPTEHLISIEPESKLAQIMGQTETTVASWHHQAVRQLAPGLKVVAQAPDGVIEAIEMPAHPWLIGVQWHPELTAVADPGQQRLFDALVNASSRCQEQNLTNAINAMNPTNAINSTNSTNSMNSPTPYAPRSPRTYGMPKAAGAPNRLRMASRDEKTRARMVNR
ncbi:MAG: gamma-glutamyl-gamma-aminobutyrate hydrolase family protein [Anaerolineae bacterium]|nr:gamma-glutamyl-gamma-aminobutyrate hydrolase family protein [Anaerolineae bacterium]MCB9104322.1 gamma-glutamyl-gamma-aminobutyrate hydrolase family protein [Anaerolineales bacterium]